MLSPYLHQDFNFLYYKFSRRKRPIKTIFDKTLKIFSKNLKGICGWLSSIKVKQVNLGGKNDYNQ
ncbi:hypothetical protein CHR53_11265 [Neobacillus mesonae]|uniref:Uncharacterized protein n=1 Tax=Neobacillus mesonae TaxID=1193713 RepID=A0A3Q9QS01_9BACI|nr:hypothetical protein CHR53_11265 [Neobacillus mesonae]